MEALKEPIDDPNELSEPAAQAGIFLIRETISLVPVDFMKYVAIGKRLRKLDRQYPSKEVGIEADLKDEAVTIFVRENL